MTRVVVYARTVTAIGDGVWSQITPLREYARKKGYEIAEVIIEVGSGTKIDPGLRNAIFLVQAHRGEKLLVTSPDRVSQVASILEFVSRQVPIEYAR